MEVNILVSTSAGQAELSNRKPEKSSGKKNADEFGAVDEVLNLSHRNLTLISGFFRTSSQDEIESFKRMIKKLTDRGIVGYEYLDIKGRPYKSFISTRFVEPYSSARIYRGPFPP